MNGSSDGMKNGSSDAIETPWCLSQYPNLAFDKLAWQSSTSHKGLAIQAVDGNREGDFSKQSCSRTAVDEVPWWVVDLQAEHNIIRVAITNGAGSYGNANNYHPQTKLRKGKVFTHVVCPLGMYARL